MNPFMHTGELSQIPENMLSSEEISLKSKLRSSMNLLKNNEGRLFISKERTEHVCFNEMSVAQLGKRIGGNFPDVKISEEKPACVSEVIPGKIFTYVQIFPGELEDEICKGLDISDTTRKEAQHALQGIGKNIATEIWSGVGDRSEYNIAYSEAEKKWYSFDNEIAFNQIPTDLAEHGALKADTYEFEHPRGIYEAINASPESFLEGIKNVYNFSNDEIDQLFSIYSSDSNVQRTKMPMEPLKQKQDFLIHRKENIFPLAAQWCNRVTQKYHVDMSDLKEKIGNTARECGASETIEILKNLPWHGETSSRQLRSDETMSLRLRQLYTDPHNQNFHVAAVQEANNTDVMYLNVSNGSAVGDKIEKSWATLEKAVKNGALLHFKPDGLGGHAIDVRGPQKRNDLGLPCPML